MFEKRFENQVAIVTGGANGLGKSIAFRLAKEGAKVTIWDIAAEVLNNAEKDFKEAGLSVSTGLVDISKEDEVKKNIDAVASRNEGSLDIMINCAGIVGPNGLKTEELTLEGFESVYRVNLRGSFLVTKYALGPMSKKNYGRILLLASIAGKEGNAGMCAYSVSKAGVVGLVKATGKEYAETGITINGLAPAVIRTSMVDSMKPEQVKYMTDKIPMKRCGTLDEISSLATWIVSKESSFNTGFVFDMTGGRATY